MISKERKKHGHCYINSKDCWPNSTTGFLVRFRHCRWASIVVIASLFLSTAATTVALGSNDVKSRDLQITEDNCADDPFFTFAIDDAGGLVGSCLDIAENPTYIANYCDRIHIKYACPATCLESQNIPCVCPEDNTEFSFTLKIGGTRACDWLTQSPNPERTEKRRSDYCYTEEYPSVRENCVFACGFCTGTFVAPSNSPTMSPTGIQSSAPTDIPSTAPTNIPSAIPTNVPTSSAPTYNPSAAPTSFPSEMPSNNPTLNSSNSPSLTPSRQPSVHPSTNTPSVLPSKSFAPTLSMNPSTKPTRSQQPSLTTRPSESPSSVPSASPTLSSAPSITSAPSFVNWREIPYESYMPNPASTTTTIILGDEDVSDPIDIGFTFDWFGNPIDQLRISSNGQLNMDPSDRSENCCRADPIGSYQRPRIAFVQEDLHPSAVGSEDEVLISRSSNPLSFKVTFNNVRFYGRSESFIQASVSLFPGGDVIFCYGQGIMNSWSFAAGIEDPVGGAYALPFQPFNASTGVTDVWPTEKCWQFLTPYGGSPSHSPSESSKPTSSSQFPSVAPTLSLEPSVSLAPSYFYWREIPYESYMPSTYSDIENITMSDDTTQKVDIGFKYNWFGNPIDQLRISSNGQLNMDPSDTNNNCCDVEPIGSNNERARIAFVQEDLNPSSIEGLIFVSRSSNPLSFKVTFNNVRFYDRSESFVQASIELIPDGDVIFCYGQGIMNSSSFAAGIEDPVSGAYALPFQPFNASTGVTDVWPTEKCWKFLMPYTLPSASPSTAPSDAPSGIPTECVDEPSWMTSADGLTCSQIEHLIFVETVDTVLEGFDYCSKLSGIIWNGKSIQEACCVCGGSAFQRIAPSITPSISVVPTFHPSESPTDCIDEPEWKIHGGITCEDLKTHNNVIDSYSWCEILGNAVYNGKTAIEACCTCGGSDYKAVAPSLSPSCSTLSRIGQDIDGKFEFDLSGTTVSLSADGLTVAIGADNHDNYGYESGHVRVYSFDSQNQGWVQVGQDIYGQAAYDFFGGSVSLSADGLTVAIGAKGHDGMNGLESGQVSIYKFNTENESWEQIGQDIDGKFEFDLSGTTVSLSADGLTVAIGADNHDNYGYESGHVRVYSFDSQNQGWVQVGQDIYGQAAYDFFGGSVSLSADGLTVAIGAPYTNYQYGLESGQVSIYKFNSENESWEQIGQYLDRNAKVSLSADGLTVAVGAPYSDSNGPDSGFVRIYKFNTENGTWEQLGQEIAGEAEYDLSGTSISLSADGLTIAIGGKGNDGENYPNSGHVRVYSFNSGNHLWKQIGQDIDGEFPNDLSGTSVSLSADGLTVAIGAPENDGIDTTNSGHVRIYNISPDCEN